MRKDLLVQVIVFIAALSYLKTAEEIWRLIVVALLGFTAVTLASCVEIGSYWVHNGFTIWIPRNHNLFWGGYGSSGAYYLPLLAGWLLASNKKPTWNYAGCFLLAVAISLTFIYGSRTPLVVVLTTTLFLLMLLKQWSKLMALLTAFLCLFALIQFAPSTPLDKYKSLLNSDTYVTNNGLSQRLSVWEGCWDVINTRPLTGYGFGWKKLARAINDGDFANRWEARPDITGYFLERGKAIYGKVNPHNYFLQVLFEIGAIGLALVVAFWCVIFRCGFSLYYRTENKTRGLAATLLAVLFGYGITNLMNGNWIGGLANLSILFSACLIVLNDKSAYRLVKERSVSKLA